MRKSERLGPVVKVAKRNEENAAKTMGEYRRVLEAHEQRLAELNEYHIEYMQRFNESASQGVEMRKINEYRSFLAKLKTAIVQQQALVDNSRYELEEKNQQWTEKRVKHKSIGKAVSRYRAEEYKHQQRREQNESDDRSQRVKSKINPQEDNT